MAQSITSNDPSISTDGEQVPGGEDFERFYKREYRAVLALAYALTGSRSRSEELVQEAFMAAFQKWSQINNPDGWIRTVVSNKVHSWRRRLYAERRAFARLDPRRDSKVDDLPSETAHFWVEVRHLPRRQAQAVALHYLEDRSVRDIALILGCSESTARDHLRRGRTRLAGRLSLKDAS